jgi:hypothetical protein
MRLQVWTQTHKKLMLGNCWVRIEFGLTDGIEFNKSAVLQTIPHFLCGVGDCLQNSGGFQILSTSSKTMTPPLARSREGVATGSGHRQSAKTRAVQNPWYGITHRLVRVDDTACATPWQRPRGWREWMWRRCWCKGHSFVSDTSSPTNGLLPKETLSCDHDT